MTPQGIRVDPYPKVLAKGLHYVHHVWYALRVIRPFPTLVPRAHGLDGHRWPLGGRDRVHRDGHDPVRNPDPVLPREAMPAPVAVAPERMTPEERLQAEKAVLPANQARNHVVSPTLPKDD